MLGAAAFGLRSASANRVDARAPEADWRPDRVRCSGQPFRQAPDAKSDSAATICPALGGSPARRLSDASTVLRPERRLRAGAPWRRAETRTSRPARLAVALGRATPSLPPLRGQGDDTCFPASTTGERKVAGPPPGSA